MTPLLSICIPTYNRVHLLERCLTSAIAQNYPEKEIIVSDNASTDETNALVTQIRASHPNVIINYIRHTQNIGMVPNWRSCLMASKGDYFMILDDDNYLIQKDYLSEVSKLCQEHPDTSLVATNYRKDWKNDLGETICATTNIKLARINVGKDIYLKYFDPVFFGHWLFFTFYRRSLALQHDIFSTSRITHDIEAMLTMMLLGRVGFLNNCAGVYDYTQGNNVPVQHYYQDYLEMEKGLTQVTPIYLLSDEERATPFIRIKQMLIRQNYRNLFLGHWQFFWKRLRLFASYNGWPFVIKSSFFAVQYALLTVWPRFLKKVIQNALHHKAMPQR
jgi:glycosyltransferase involved in cell wall biosynthesis